MGGISIRIRYFQKGFNYSQDGPGNRLVYHLSACNMRCPWCSNPEGMTIRDEHHSEDIKTLADEIVCAAPMFFEGGGVTFTGGECSLQSDSLIALIDILKENNINVAIESNASTLGFLELAKKCDHVITDYKHPDPEVLKRELAGELSLIEQNIRDVLNYKDIIIRIPLINGFNVNDDALEGFCSFFESLKDEKHGFSVELLCYHEYGKTKWEKLGLEYTVKNGEVSKKTLMKFTEAFKARNIKVINT